MLQRFLEFNTGEPAVELLKLLGQMKFESQIPETGKPYDVTHSSINTLDLTNHCPANQLSTMALIHSNGGHEMNQFELWRKRDSGSAFADFRSEFRQRMSIDFIAC